MEDYKVMPMKGFPLTDPEVFVIEALHAADYDVGRADGDVLANHLHLMGVQKAYCKVKNKIEFQDAIIKFKLSRCRFLHVSCHGEANANVLDIGDDAVNYEELATLLKGSLTGKRIAFSACYLGNDRLARILFGKNKGLHSFMAFSHSVAFDLASAFWIAYYTMAVRAANVKRNKTGNPTLRNAVIASYIEKLCNLFGVSVNFSWSSPAPRIRKFFYQEFRCGWWKKMGFSGFDEETARLADNLKSQN